MIYLVYWHLLEWLPGMNTSSVEKGRTDKDSRPRYLSGNVLQAGTLNVQYSCIGPLENKIFRSVVPLQTADCSIIVGQKTPVGALPVDGLVTSYVLPIL